MRERRVRVELMNGRTVWLPVRDVAFLLSGRDIPEGHEVVNTCGEDDPDSPCVNPEHLIAVPRRTMVLQ